MCPQILIIFIKNLLAAKTARTAHTSSLSGPTLVMIRRWWKQQWWQFHWLWKCYWWCWWCHRCRCGWSQTIKVMSQSSGKCSTRINKHQHQHHRCGWSQTIKVMSQSSGKWARKLRSLQRPASSWRSNNHHHPNNKAMLQNEKAASSWIVINTRQAHSVRHVKLCWKIPQKKSLSRPEC